MKFRSWSSGCESRPARGEPVRAGSEPGDGLGNEAGEAKVHERVSHGVTAPKTMTFRMPKVLFSLKAMMASPWILSKREVGAKERLYPKWGSDWRQLLVPKPDNYFCRCGEFPLLLR